MSKVFFIFLSLVSSLALEATSPLVAQRAREEKYELIRPKAQEYHEQMLSAYNQANWSEVIYSAMLLKNNYPTSPLMPDAYYYMGVAYFKQGEYDHANLVFTDYLKQSQNLRNFEEAVDYKFQIAKLYESGVRKRLFGIKKMPKILPAKDEALNIFDEVAAALPRSELACQSLYRKAGLLIFFEEYKDAIENYQTLVRRFPKNPLAPRSYSAISDIYLKQCQREFPDPELVELAEINLKKFQNEYPTEPLILDVKQRLVQTKAIFAEELFTVGNYFAKKKKYQSAYIYYKTIISKYPETKFHELAYQKIEVLKKKSGRPQDFEVSL